DVADHLVRVAIIERPDRVEGTADAEAIVSGMVGVLADLRRDLTGLDGLGPEPSAALLHRHARLLSFIQAHAFGLEELGDAKAAGPMTADDGLGRPPHRRLGRMRAITWIKERGAEFAEVSLGGSYLRAAGVAVGAEPLPYRLDYELDCEEGFVTRRLLVRARGAGWGPRPLLSRPPPGPSAPQAPPPPRARP